MKKIIFFILAVVIVSLIVFINSIFGCSVTDEDAIVLAKAFCGKLNISYQSEPRVSATRNKWPMLNSKIKEISFGKKSDIEIGVNISCRNKEVVSYFNWQVEKNVREKYKIPWVTTEPHNWPPFLPETKAKEIIFSIANKIGLPPDVEFSKMGIDRENGMWGGYWKRKRNGFPYEDDYIAIKIMAVDGEFYHYRKWFLGELCSTEVKINKDEAIEEGWQYVGKFYETNIWNAHRDKYEVESAELLIVQPNVFFGKTVNWYSSKSRLAWAIIYKLKEPKKNRWNLYERIIIKIDAATKKYLGGDYTL